MCKKIIVKNGYGVVYNVIWCFIKDMFLGVLNIGLNFYVDKYWNVVNIVFDLCYF